MINKANWPQTQQKFINWWKRKNEGRPLMIVMAKKDDPVPLPEEYKSASPEDKWTNAEKIVGRFRNWCQNTEFLGESFPNLSVDFGPGS